MTHTKIQLAHGQADAYLIPLGPVNLVFAHTKTGMIACGAFDVDALDKFNYPAAAIKGPNNAGIAAIQDLLTGQVKHANKTAADLGIKTGMSGRQALDKM